jgi:cell division protein FtsI (penicillin-binding protein 3)
VIARALKALRPRRKTATRSGAAARSVRYGTSPLLASPTPAWRSKMLVALVGIGFAALAARAAYVQIVGSDFYQRQGEQRFTARFDVPASRGRIFDRNGAMLAGSVVTPQVAVAPRDFTADREQRRQLARLLGMSHAELADKLDDKRNFVWLDRKVDEATAEKVKALKLPGLVFERGYQRVYPEAAVAAHVVGFTDIDEHGREGIERAFDHLLEGRKGSRHVVRDRLGRVVEDTGERVEPVDGRDVHLSIDAKVQGVAYQHIRDAVGAHKARAGSVVVLDVTTGEILALANVPTYNPTERQNLVADRVRNRALTDVFEPGSTMKPFTVAWALETRRVAPTTPIQTAPGRITISGSTISDAHPHGVLTVAEVVQKSSNVGTVKMAMQMPAREMWELFSQVGFGQRPQIEFPGAVSGRLRPFKSWRPVEQATMSYGYGLSTSLLQLARAYTVFARDGEVIPVTVLKRSEPVEGVPVLSPRTAQAMRKMLRMAAAEKGTAPKAQTKAYSVGGKTGTARKQEGKTYANDRYRAWFVGMAPIDHPRIVVAVMVDEPSNGQHYGGDVAAPVFSKVVEQTLRMLGVPPDLDVQQQIVTTGGVEESF